MIPLIDVSLVLLIFFMLTTTDIAAAAPGSDAARRVCVRSSTPRLRWVGITSKETAPTELPFIRRRSATRAAPGTAVCTPTAELLDRLEQLLKSKEKVELTIDAHPEVKSGDVRQLTVELEQPRFKGR